jgi:prepilin peptidase CpaA
MLPLAVLSHLILVGAGDAKLYGGFGAWVVPIPWFGFTNLWWAMAYSIVLGGVMGVAIILQKRMFYLALERGRETVADLTSGSSIEDMRTRGRERKKSATLLPYGIPLTIGSLAYLAILFYQQAVRLSAAS